MIINYANQRKGCEIHDFNTCSLLKNIIMDRIVVPTPRGYSTEIVG